MNPLDRRTIKWAKRMVDLALFVKGWSKDPSTKVGAAIFDQDFRIMGIGFNGFPRGIEDTTERLNDRAQKYPRVIHAEVNAVLNAQSTRGHFLACSHMPCADCAKVIIQAGIVCVAIPEETAMVAGWTESSNVAIEMFGEAGVRLIQV